MRSDGNLVNFDVGDLGRNGEKSNSTDFGNHFADVLDLEIVLL